MTCVTPVRRYYRYNNNNDVILIQMNALAVIVVVVVVVVIILRASNCAGCARACVLVGVCSARVTVDAPLPWSISAQSCAKRYHVQFDAKIATCI